MVAIPSHKRNIMIHCLATSKSWADGKSPEAVLEAVTKWHVVDNGWSDVAYAEIHMPDGTVIKGRDLDKDGDVWEETGAGARGWNRNTIHLALVGGFGSKATDNFNDHYSAQQDQSLRSSIDKIQRAAKMLGFRPLRVMGHNEIDAKECPGFYVPTWHDLADDPINVQANQESFTMSKSIEESATLWAVFLLTAVQAINDSGLIVLLPQGAQDIWGYVIAFVAVLMRLKTTSPVSIRKPKQDNT